MQKTKLGVTVGALGAITYLAGFFGGYVAAILLAGYVLLFEENAWLRRSVVKAIVILAFFSVTIGMIKLIPDGIVFINSIATVFNGQFTLVFVSRIVTAVVNGLELIEKIMFLGLGAKALNQGTIVIPVIDKKVSKYMD